MKAENNNARTQDVDPTQYFENRVVSVNQFASKGIPFYPHKFQVNCTLSEIHAKYSQLEDGQHFEDVTVKISGRIMRIASSGTKIKFYDLRGDFTKIQIISQENYHSDESIPFSTIHDQIKRGDIVGIVGFPGKSKRGELSVFSTQIIILAPCLHMLPDKSGLKDPEIRFRHRYIDLITNDNNVKTFLTRAKVISFVRNFLEKQGFVEVETPILNFIAGGATAKPFITHHNYLNHDLYLRIAPELFLKELIVGGIEKVFEIGKNFRNEAIDLTHNPEFSSCEFYWAYADYNDLMEFTEKMLSELVYSIKGSYIVTYHPDGHEGAPIDIDFTPPFDRLPIISEIEKKSGETFFSPLDSEENKEKMIKILKDNDVELPQPQTVAKLIDQLCGHFVEGSIKNKPAFIMDHPQLMSPLAKWHRNKPELTERFELFVCGKELINAYTELNDPQFQRKCFYEQAKAKAQGDDEIPAVDETFLSALEYGLPPTAGWGFGLDRMTMFLTDNNNIKEVILFPAMRPKVEN